MGLHRYSPFSPGTVYLCSGEDNHFWVVLSDPAKDKDHILVVNWTTHADYKEQTCILEAGEHRCLTRRCCVYYIGAQIVNLNSLQYGELCNTITVIQEPLAAKILQRIREGASQSDNILKAGPVLLREQGFIV